MPRFESTFWTLIESAKRSSPTALDRLVSKYRPAVLAHARARGLDASAAEDAAQEVFIALVHERVLEKADRAKGRFRNLLIKVTRNIIRRMRERAGAQKRGGGQPLISLDAARGDSDFDLGSALESRENDRDFDRTWLKNLVELAMGRLKEEYREEGKIHYDLLAAFAYGEKSYQEIAAEAGRSEKDVKNLLYLARKRLVEMVHEEIASYCSTSEEYEEEIAYLSQFLRKE